MSAVASRGVAVVGCGWAGRYAHLEPLRDLVGARLLWTIDRDPELAASSAAEFGAAHHGTDLAAALRDPAVEAVVVASPTALHAQHTIAALDAGKHVLVEKPMAASAAEARAMTEVAQSVGARLMVAHCCRFMPAFLEARRLIQEGRVGSILQVQSRRNARIASFKPWWNAERPDGFLLSWLGSHHVDMTLWLIGSQPRRIYAEMGRNTPELVGDDGFSLMMSFDRREDAGSTVVSIDHSMRSGEPHHDFLVIGSSCTLRVEDYVNLFVDGTAVDLGSYYGPDEPRTSHASYPRQMREFLSAIGEGRTPAVSGKDGVATMEVIDACYRAAATHTVQRLD